MYLRTNQEYADIYRDNFKTMIMKIGNNSNKQRLVLEEITQDYVDVNSPQQSTNQF